MLIMDVSQRVAVLSLNRPDKLNALSTGLRNKLHKELNDLEGSDEVDVIIITGKGRAFCAGLDLQELAARPDALHDAEDPVALISQMTKPTIAAINGVAITGGWELALACDFVVASTDARFADTHAKVGILPGWGISQKLSRLVGPYRAKQLSLTGMTIDATTANSWGLVNEVVSPDELIGRAKILAGALTAGNQNVIRAYKQLIDSGYATTLGDALVLETGRFVAASPLQF